MTIEAAWPCAKLPPCFFPGMPMNRIDPLSFPSLLTDALQPERLLQLLDRLPVSLILFSADGQLRFANPAAIASYGEALQTKGAAYAEDIAPGLFARVLQSGEALSCERRLHDRYFQITLTPLCAASGKIDSVLETHTEITSLRQETRRLQLLHGHMQELAHRDTLTGLGNRRYLGLRLERLAAEALPRYAALLYVDLHGFKRLNECHGDAVGDAVLALIGSRFRVALRATDLLCRAGGDEFAILLEDISESGARAVANKIITAVQEPVSELGEPNRLGISVGICLFRSGSDMPAELLPLAEQAMRRAKQRGGAQFELEIV